MWENINISNMSQQARNYLVAEPNYHTTKYFPGNVLAVEIKKKILMIKLCI